MCHYLDIYTQCRDCGREIIEKSEQIGCAKAVRGMLDFGGCGNGIGRERSPSVYNGSWLCRTCKQKEKETKDGGKK